MLRLIVMTLILSILLCLFACGDKKLEDEMTMNLRYIEQICCGNFVVNDSTEVGNCSNQDYLLRVENMNAFSIEEDYAFGDVLRVEFRVLEACEASCEITCNRWNGIPIEIIAIEEE